MKSSNDGNKATSKIIESAEQIMEL